MKRLKTYQKILYGAGDSSSSIVYTITSFFLMFFFTDVLGMPPGYASIVLIIGNIVDAIIDPFIGYLSDNSRSRLGRRKAFMGGAIFPMTATFCLLWFVPQLSHLGVALWTGLAYVAFVVFYSLYSVSYMAFGMEMSDDYDERTSLVSWRMLFSIVIGLLAAVLPQMFVDMYPKTSVMGYRLMAIVFGSAAAVTCIFPLFAAKDKPAIQKSQFHFFRDFGLALTNKPFIIASSISLLAWFGLQMIETNMLYYFKYILKTDNVSVFGLFSLDMFSAVAAVIFLSAAAFLPFFVWVSEKSDKRMPTLYGVGSLGVLLLLLLLDMNTVRVIIFPLCVLLGFGVSAIHIMPKTLLPDAIDHGNAYNDQDAGATYYGIQSFVEKLSTSLAVSMSGFLLQISGYHASKAGEIVVQPESALTAIRLTMSAIPAVFIIAGALLALAYPITREKYNAIKEILSERRNKA